MSDLPELLERVEKATGPDRELDLALQVISDGGEPSEYVINPQFQHLLPTYTASLDAALALVERMLPGWFCNSLVASRGPYADLFDSFASGTTIWQAHAATRPLAILAALLRALIAQQTGDGK